MKKYMFLFILFMLLPLSLQATQIGTKQIKDKAITTAKIDDEAVEDTQLGSVLKGRIDSAVEKTDGTSFGTTPSSVPTSDYEFANKKYVDDAIGADTTLFIWKDGGQDFEADQSMGGFKLIELADAINPTDAVNLQTMLNTYGTILTYWLMPNNSLGQELTEIDAYDTELIISTPQTLTDIYFKSTVLDTPTPFVIKDGSIIQVHFEARVASVTGTKPTTLHAELYYMDSDGSSNPQQIGGGDEETATLTEIKTAYYTHIHADTDIIVPAGKRLWLKYVATTTGGNTDPTVWIYNGSIDGHIDIGVSATILGRYLLKAGGTMAGDVDYDGSYQVVGLQAPGANGEAIRQTAKISESILESLYDNRVDTYTYPLGISSQTVSMTNVDNSATDGYLTWEQFAILEDKYTQAEANTLLDDKLDIADSPVISDITYNATSWDSNTDAASKNAIRDKVETMNTAIGLNTAKNTNVPTALSVGTVGENTVAITSDGGVDDVTLPAATVTTAGMLTIAKWGEIVANTAKDTNVSTDLSEGTSTETTVDVNSSDGTNATLVSASTSRAGILTKGKFDEIVANTAKANSLTRYLHWSPAYDGYALSADGGSNDAGDSGIIVAFAGTLGDSDTTDTSYIEWTSTETGVTDYDVIIRIPIPADYSSIGTMTVEYQSDTVLEDTATIYVYDSTDTVDSGANGVTMSSSTWDIESLTLAGTYTAGNFLTIKLHLECAQNQSMRVGEIRIPYTATR